MNEKIIVGICIIAMIGLGYIILIKDTSKYDILFNGTEIQTRGNIEVLKNIAIINQPGVYVISGQSSDGMIMVDYEGEDEITLILNELHLESKIGPAVYIKKSGDANIFLPEHTTNFIADAWNYSAKFEKEITGAIYSKSDLDILGKGSLTVYGNHNNALVSRDDLNITHATLKVRSINDGIHGRDRVEIENADIHITARGHGLRSYNKKEGEKSYIRISETTMEISAGNDGIKAQNQVDIESGNITIFSSSEGIEVRRLNIYNGLIKIYSGEDPLNATMKKEEYKAGNPPEEVYINIYGGEISLFARDDGIDSNGKILVTGGTLIISGPAREEWAENFDSNNDFTVKGGKIIVTWPNPNGIMPRWFSTQYSMRVDTTGVQSAGTVIRIVNTHTKEELLHFIPKRPFKSIMFSSPDLRISNNYTLYFDDTIYATITLTDIVTILTAEGKIRSFKPEGVPRRK